MVFTLLGLSLSMRIYGEGIYASLAVVPKFGLRMCIIFMVMLP